jgi:hypothetical protein
VRVIKAYATFLREWYSNTMLLNVRHKAFQVNLIAVFHRAVQAALLGLGCPARGWGWIADPVRAVRVIQNPFR